MEDEYINCFACGAKGLNIEGDTHPYMLSSPGCWAIYNEVLEREYTNIHLAKANHFTADAYACQHPGNPDVSQAFKSVGLHLACLHMVFDKGMDVGKGGDFKNEFSQLNKHLEFMCRLDPPSNLGEITVFDLWNLEDPAEHSEIREEWARSTWQAWRGHHSTIEEWIAIFLNQSSKLYP